jgi:hypothetical protein
LMDFMRLSFRKKLRKRVYPVAQSGKTYHPGLTEPGLPLTNLPSPAQPLCPGAPCSHQRTWAEKRLFSNALTCGLNLSVFRGTRSWIQGRNLGQFAFGEIDARVKRLHNIAICDIVIAIGDKT